MSTSVTRRHNRVVPFLVVPFGLLFAGFYLLPICYAAYQSLFTTKRSGLGFGTPTQVFAGLDNYTKALSDPAFRAGLARVLVFGVVQVPVMLGLALLLALLLDGTAARFPRFFRVAYFLPYAMPGVIAALLWSFLYHPALSPFIDLVDVSFFSPSMLLWSIGNIVTWAYTGFNMLVIYSSLKAIPRDLYEAAELDGCSPWRIAWHIKIPLVRPALTLTAVFSIIGTLQLFNEPTVLRKLQPGSVAQDYTPIMKAYQVAIGNNDYGQGAAIAVALALITAAASFAFLRGTTWLTSRKASS